MPFALIALLTVIGLWAIWDRLTQRLDRMLAVDRDLARAKAEAAALRRQMTADLTQSHRKTQPLGFLDNPTVSDLQREIEFHRARQDDSIDARLNVLLVDSVLPIIKHQDRYTPSQVAEAYEKAGKAIGRLRQLMSHSEVDHVTQAGAEEQERGCQEAVEKGGATDREETQTAPEPVPKPESAREVEPELRRIDEGVVAANPVLTEADTETLAAYGLHRQADGIYMEPSSPIDPRDLILVMSEEAVVSRLEEMDPLEGMETTDAEAHVWLTTASLDELTKFHDQVKENRKRDKLTLRKVTEEIDLRFDRMFEEDDSKEQDDE